LEHVAMCLRSEDWSASEALFDLPLRVCEPP